MKEVTWNRQEPAGWKRRLHLRQACLAVVWAVFVLFLAYRSWGYRSAGVTILFFLGMYAAGALLLYAWAGLCYRDCRDALEAEEEAVSQKRRHIHEKE